MRRLVRRATATCASVLLACLAVAFLAGCSGSQESPTSAVTDSRPSALRFVDAPRALLEDCERTARAVGYPVPCPHRVPAGLRPTGAVAGCSLAIIGPGGVGACAKSWRGWVVGSSETNDQHLVITAAPGSLRGGARLVNGPAWYAGARVRALKRLRARGWRIQAVYVPAARNEGSAFAHHVVFIWTVGGHTYGVGFHNVLGLRQTLLLNERLIRNIRLVRP
jgi:hypothetical protein